MHTFLNNLANRQTDRQTDKHRGQSHIPPLLSEVNNNNNTYIELLRAEDLLNAKLK